MQRTGFLLVALWAVAGTLAAASVAAPPFLQQVAAAYTTEHGLPAIDVHEIALTPDLTLLARTAAGVAAFDTARERWLQVALVLPADAWPPGTPPPPSDGLRASASSPAATAAITADGLLWVHRLGQTDRGGADTGSGSAWLRPLPSSGSRSWAPVDVRAVAFDDRGTLWFASPQGIGAGDPETDTWRLWDERDGLPWNDFTSLAVAPDGSVWLGTTLGLVHLVPPGGGEDGRPRWEYRQGRRWLPHDHVRDVAVGADGTVWAATAGGVAAIRHVPMTLRDKARRFEAQIDRHHRRTPYGYVESAQLERPGDLSRWTNHDSDNDGLWTAMYGAGECFAWAATRDPAARRRARAAFEALRFLGDVTQGGEHAPPPGFPARSILPTDGPDPNEGTLERDRERRARNDRSWKVLEPRWPRSADGKWYWKTDTSSDELDGHYFFYALYHDLVAEGAERDEVRAVVVRLTDHLLAHDLALVDHDGQPTRWAVFGPRQLDHQKDWWEERGLNSLSMLAYLRIAEHVSGDTRYGEAARKLIEEHAYAANARVPKIHSGPGTGNQSDDEMAFMGLYHLVRYERDPVLRSIWAHTFHRYFEVERPERNPLFAFLYAAAVWGESYHDAFDDLAFEPDASVLDEALESLQRYPLDRVDWELHNSHRLDVVPLAASDPASPRGHLRGGRVLPIDERHVDKWNHDPWRLDQGGQGLRLADPASFLLPYYLGLHHGFLVEAEP